MPDQATTAEMLELAEQIKALPMPGKLRLAAGLIQAGKLKLAESLVDKVRDELLGQRLRSI